MDALFALVSPQELAFAMAVALFAGFVKGVVGFAMPMILISGLSTLLAPDLALAGLILPTLVTNLMQAFAQGPGAAWQSTKRFRLFLVVGGIVLVISAQLVRVLPIETLLLVIGIPVFGFALLQLSGWRWTLARQTPGVEAGVGVVAGFLGGMSGVWGPATVLYLTALNTEKTEQIRIQGVIYGAGAVVLMAAHIASGVLNAQTMWFSLALVLPAVLGGLMGQRVMNRIDQAQFKTITLLVLLFAGLNLIRRALFG